MLRICVYSFCITRQWMLLSGTSMQDTGDYTYFSFHSAVIAKIIYGGPAGLQSAAGHFESLSDIFRSLRLANISGHSRFPCRPFHIG